MNPSKYKITEEGCWEWLGCKNQKGYGQTGTKINGAWKTVRAHRLSYEIHKGSIPKGKQLDHLCRNRACINPDHLEPVTSRENTMRSPVSMTAQNSRKTACLNGHPFTEENTRHFTGKWGFPQRSCKECAAEKRRVSERKRRAKKREQRLALEAALETPS